ncbi:MAG: hypothetical protein WC314_07710 [Vulcanimicrobiota bacterium]
MNINTSGKISLYGQANNRPNVGPDDVYDEFDNGRADTGPDAVVDEFDNSRSRSGSSYSYDSWGGSGGSDYIGGHFIG